MFDIAKYNVLIVDDSAFMRKLISDFIHEDPDFVVIDSARNGKEAYEKTIKLRPDAITMDINMPEMDGLDAVKMIMKECPTPIIMLSSLTMEGAEETVQALELGALDFVQKPSGAISLDLHKIKPVLLEKLRMAVNAKIKNTDEAESKTSTTPKVNVVAATPLPAKPSASKSRISTPKDRFEHLVAIGTSTGGPKALHQVITRLPANFPAPVLIVQHMPPNFTKSLAQRLNSFSAIDVVEAEDGMPVQAGVAYIAPGGWHMKLNKAGVNLYKIELTKEDPRNGHRPSVDTMFESLVSYQELKRHIVIMTGMGSDGAKGMKTLNLAGVDSTIAESKETCIVYGMPRAAVDLNCVKHIVPLHQISDKLIEIIS